MAGYRHAIRVRFQHCDPAGIVFYPRYFEMLNETAETFFEEGVGWSYAAMHGPDRRAVPTARIETEFHAPSYLGDRLDWTLAVARIGGASLDLLTRASCDGAARVTFRSTLVLVDADSMKAVRWPDEVRATLATFTEEAP